MMEHQLWVFLHILLFVYWLGGDLGVFVLAKAAKRADLSFAERAFALRMAITIDLLPRLCFAVMFPVGLHVSVSGGYALIPSWALALAWLIAIAWIALLFLIGKHEGTPRGAQLGQINLVLQGALFLVLATLGATALLGFGPLPGGWFGAKVLLFAVIFAASIGIDIAFRPIGPAFAELAARGSEPQIEQSISQAVDGAIRYVLLLYGLIVAIAFLGVTKFF
jgi:hypothetical protein